MGTIGLFGGSFNPPHAGHKALIQSFLSSGLIDQCWVIPVHEPPHKNAQHLISYVHRANMAKLLIKGLKNVQISEIEKEIQGPNYSFKTIDVLKNRYPEHEWVLCLGSDSMAYFHRWVKPERILAQVKRILVAERPNAPLDQSLRAQSKVSVITEHKPRSYSSTEIRQYLSERVHGEYNRLSEMQNVGINKAIADYIFSHQLYIV